LALFFRLNFSSFVVGNLLFPFPVNWAQAGVRLWAAAELDTESCAYFLDSVSPRGRPPKPDASLSVP
jgi:hypothetical protein